MFKTPSFIDNRCFTVVQYPQEGETVLPGLPYRRSRTAHISSLGSEAEADRVSPDTVRRCVHLPSYPPSASQACRKRPSYLCLCERPTCARGREHKYPLINLNEGFVTTYLS
jgi:hypothetical protein